MIVRDAYPSLPLHFLGYTFLYMIAENVLRRFSASGHTRPGVIILVGDNSGSHIILITALRSFGDGA
jgi:hypothetical protein